MQQTAIVTGGTEGLGFHTARLLAENHQRAVVVAGRSAAKGHRAVRKLKKNTGNQRVFFIVLDLSDFDKIHQFVRRYQERVLPPLTVLINNAGIHQYNSTTHYTRQGYEMTFGVNHLGHFLLTQQLLPLMEEGSRIINVASGVHNPDMKTGMPAPRYTSAQKLAYPRNLSSDEPDLGKERYTTSKLCNVLYTYRLAAELESRRISVNAFDPGMMPGTGLARQYPWYLRLAWKYIMPISTLFSNRVNTPAQSARVLDRWATESAYADKTGRYFYVGGEESSSAESHREDWQNDLWEFSLRHTPPEPATKKNYHFKFH